MELSYYETILINGIEYSYDKTNNVYFNVDFGIVKDENLDDLVEYIEEITRDYDSL